jgi:hypothetical protein
MRVTRKPVSSSASATMRASGEALSSSPAADQKSIMTVNPHRKAKLANQHYRLLFTGCRAESPRRCRGRRPPGSAPASVRPGAAVQKYIF